MIRASPCDYYLSTLVALLLRVCGPTAVAGCVVAVVVLAVDCLPSRASSHVSQEVLELRPASAHLDAAASVVFVVDGFWIGAARTHRFPNPVFGRLTTLAMSLVGLTSSTFVEAATRCRSSAQEVVG